MMNKSSNNNQKTKIIIKIVKKRKIKSQKKPKNKNINNKVKNMKITMMNLLKQNKQKSNQLKLDKKLTSKMDLFLFCLPRRFLKLAFFQ